MNEVARVARVVEVTLAAKLVERRSDRLRIGAAAIEQPLQLSAGPIALAQRPVAVAERVVERLAQAACSSGGSATGSATAIAAASSVEAASRSIGVTRSWPMPSAV